jgi:hypothetical protein
MYLRGIGRTNPVRISLAKKGRGVRNPLMSKNVDDKWDSQRDRMGDGQYRGVWLCPLSWR